MRRRNVNVQQETLRRRVEACKSTHATARAIVNHLRYTYSADYHRTKHQTLMRLVYDALQSITAANTPPTRKHGHDDEGRDECRKRQRKIDEGEEKLQNVEASRDLAPLTSPVEDGTNASSSEGVEPGFDLLKTNLPELYKGTITKNVELEVGNSSKATSPVNEGEVEGEAKSARKQFKGSGSHSSGSGSGSGSGSEVEVKNEIRFRDLGGMKEILERLKREVLMPLCMPQGSRRLQMPSGILLHGPPGCGKTMLAHAIANETGFPFYHIDAPALVSGVLGSSEENIRELFSKAYRTAPSIVFIDEIDAIASKIDNLQRGMERRIVSQLLACMNQPLDSHKSSNHVLVIGATNRPDAIDPALRRPGRFTREFTIGIPDESARKDILSVLIRSLNLKLEDSIDLQKIARSTPGFVGADLRDLAAEADELAMMRIVDERYYMREYPDDWWRGWSPEECDKRAIKMSDFEEAIKLKKPSTRREGFSSIPDVKWEDIGGLDSLRQELDDLIVNRIKDPEIYKRYGADFETGILLYGPPGCGKTLIAKAVANAAGANFIYIKGPELLNKYVGESELAIRTLFSRARTCAPCILFFDEVDALTTRRGIKGGRVIEGLVNQLLIELDGAEQRRDVYVIGATNRPEVVDCAMLRPGRLGTHIYVPLPSPEDRVLILKALARDKRLDAGVDLDVIGRMKACENMSGSDLRELMGRAAGAAVEEERAGTNTTCTIKTHHFDVAFSKVSPSVSDKQMRYYRRLTKRFK